MRYTIGIVAALLLLAGAAVFAAPGDGSTNNGIIQGTKVDGKAISPASVTTTGNVTVGGSLIKTGTSGETSTCGWHESTLTFAANPGDASKTWSSAFPQGASSPFHVVTKTLVAGTNCTSVSYGDNTAPGVGMFGTTIAVAAGTTTTDASWTGQMASPQLTASDVKITANGGNCFDLSVRVAVHYCTSTAPTL